MNNFQLYESVDGDHYVVLLGQAQRDATIEDAQGEWSLLKGNILFIYVTRGRIPEYAGLCDQSASWDEFNDLYTMEDSQ